MPSSTVAISTKIKTGESKMNQFESFCHRMWLDYCEEHKQPLGGERLLSYEEYVAKYKNYLEEKYEANGFT